MTEYNTESNISECSNVVSAPITETASFGNHNFTNAGKAAPADARISLVLSIAERGWKIFPCRLNDKSPIIKDWPSLATTDAAQIRAWAKQHPGCNWACATGPGSGVFVLDVDGEKGKASLERLPGKVPATLQTHTANGTHFWFRWPEGIQVRNSASKIGEGLDIRGNGGYVMVPPSTHPSGTAYEFDNREQSVAEAPKWLLDVLADSALVMPKSGDIQQDTEGGSIGIGERHRRLTHIIGRMLRDGMAIAAIEAAALSENQTFDPPKHEEAVRKLVTDLVQRYPQKGTRPSSPSRAELISLASIESKEVEWLWRPYLPIGMLAMLSGDPGAGKTYVSLAIAACLTTGKVPCSEETCLPIDVLYMSNENDPACVVRPRFDLLGGDPARLHLLRGSAQGAVWLTDTDTLHEALQETGSRLVIVDPIQSFLGAGVDVHRSNETRPVLDGLGRLAEEHSCCVLLLRHLSKAASGRAIHRGLGSIDLTGAVRCEMLAGSSADDNQRRAMVQIKNNVGVYGPALGYRIDENGLSWTGESALTQADLLAPEPMERQSALSDAVDWLRGFLASGPRPASELEQAAKARNISKTTLHSAKIELNVSCRKLGFNGGWEWRLPQEATTPPPSEDSKVFCTENLESSGGVGLFAEPQSALWGAHDRR